MTHAERLWSSPVAFRQLNGITPAAFDGLLDELRPRHAATPPPARTGPDGDAGPEPGASMRSRSTTGCRCCGSTIGPTSPTTSWASCSGSTTRRSGGPSIRRPVPRPARRQRRPVSGRKRLGKEEAAHAQASGGRPAAQDPLPDGKPRPRKAWIAAVSTAFPGRTHDKQTYDRTRAVGPPGVPRTGDAASLGSGLAPPAASRAAACRRPASRGATAGRRGGGSRPSTASARGGPGGSRPSVTATPAAGTP